MAQYKLVLLLNVCSKRHSSTFVQSGAPQRLLKEEIHLMNQPDEFVEPKTIDHVSKLKHGLYGRKWSPRILNQIIDDYIRKISDPSSARYCMSSVMA